MIIELVDDIDLHKNAAFAQIIARRTVKSKQIRKKQMK